MQNREGQGGHSHDHSHHDHSHHQHDARPQSGKVKDPVCGMLVDPHTTPHRAQYEGKPYCLCSSGCQSAFMAEPAKYVEPAVAQNGLGTSKPRPMRRGSHPLPPRRAHP